MKWNIFSNKKEEIMVSPFQSFSTPFGTIGKGNLSLPYVRSYGAEPYVRFGTDNLYPQIINQMYYMSPLNQSIINFKKNSIIGGGYELTSDDMSGFNQINLKVFQKRNDFKRLVNQTTFDYIQHGRICLFIDNTDPKDITIKRIGPEKVRTRADKAIHTYSEDWSRSIGLCEFPNYDPKVKCKSIYVFEMTGESGQDYYPIPGYCSALNWIFVDGQMSYLHKSNIINSVFPSFMIKLAKKFSSALEMEEFKKVVNGAKGAEEAGKVMTFVANSIEELPSVEAIPTSDNQNLFAQTDGRIDLQLSRAHSIDPLLVGIRTSGALGSGTDIQIAYTIYEKNIVMPLRETMIDFFDKVLDICDINASISINNYQIIDNVIIDKTLQIQNNNKL